MLQRFLKRKVEVAKKEEEKNGNDNAGAPKPNLKDIPFFLPKDMLKRAHDLFFHSEGIQYLSKEQNQVFVGGSYKQVPRKQAAYSPVLGMTYSFSGTTVEARDEAEVPLLKELRLYVEEKTGVAFNFVFINYYETGQNTIGWHSDDEKDMVAGATIGSLTFGTSRDFDFRLKKDSSVKHRVQLHDNHLLLMLHPTNRDWHHSLPRRARVNQPRVNLTFRQFKTQASLF